MKPANWGALAIAMLLAACRGGGSGTNVLPISAGNERFAQQADFGSQVSHTKTVKLVEDKPLPIPAHGAFSGTFTEKSFSAPKGTTVTLESFTLKPSPAPTPVAPEGPGFQYQTSFWVRQEYSASVLLKSLPQIAWHVPPGFSTSHKFFLLAAFDGTTRAAIPPLFYPTSEVRDDVATFPAINLWFCRYGRCGGGYRLRSTHIYWWEFIVLQVKPIRPATVREFKVPSEPRGITPGPDRALWFSEDNLKVGRITLDGKLSQFPLRPGASCVDAGGITVGPDGNVWLTDSNCRSMIAKVTPDGKVTEYKVSNKLVVPASIVAGSDGNLWFTEGYANKIGRITTDGKIKEFPTSAAPGNIAAGPDGALWFTEPGKIARMTTAGVITNEFVVPHGSPYFIATGADRNLWFSGYVRYHGFGYELNGIGKMTTKGDVTDYVISPLPGHAAAGIALGPDGNIWFTEYDDCLIGRITPSGSITEFKLGGRYLPYIISAGPKGDSHMWFTNYYNTIGSINI